MKNNSGSLAIRALSADDYDRWLPLWKSYQSFYKVIIADDVSRESFRRMLDEKESTFGALAFQGEQEIGLVHWILHRSNWSIANTCYLEDLFVRENWRQLGAGRLLIEHVYSKAQKAGSASVYWLTHETNTAARALYERIAERSGFLHYQKRLGNITEP